MKCRELVEALKEKMARGAGGEKSG